MINEFARVLRAHLREVIEHRKSELASGRVADFPEYKRLVGLIRGLEIADEYIADLAKRAETDDDE